VILPPGPESIAFAAQLIVSGKLVGLPTETVYGIGVDAFQPEAVARVFELKGRPAENPLIVHLASIGEVSRIAKEFSPQAEELAERFWPGPLTLVVRKRPEIPDIVTAGLDTVAVRVPKHAVASAVIGASKTAIAAPSANRFMGLSPTRAHDISVEIAEGLAAVLDGGPCAVGIESTVVDVSGKHPVLLRLGGLSRTAIEAVIGPVPAASNAAGKRPAPGMYPRHYAPRAKVRIVNRVADDAAGLVIVGPPGGLRIRMPNDEAGYARDLFHTLHELDGYDVELIEIEAPPAEWEAVWDRLRRASAE